MKGALIAAPGDNLTPSAAVVWTVNGPNPAFPVTNVQTLEPDIVAKANAAGPATLHATLGPGGAMLAGVALINTNLGGQTAVLTSSVGHSVTKVVPPTSDGLNVNVYWDLRDLPQIAATDWAVNITSASPVPVAIGTLVLVRAWTVLRVRWGWEWVEHFPRIEHRTGYGKRMQYWIPIRTRRYTATAFEAHQRNLLRALKQAAHGSLVPWTLVPDYEDDTVVLVQFVEEDQTETHTMGHGRFDTGTAKGVVEMPIAVEEVNNGVGL